MLITKESLSLKLHNISPFTEVTPKRLKSDEM